MIISHVRRVPRIAVMFAPVLAALFLCWSVEAQQNPLKEFAALPYDHVMGSELAERLDLSEPQINEFQRLIRAYEQALNAAHDELTYAPSDDELGRRDEAMRARQLEYEVEIQARLRAMNIDPTRADQASLDELERIRVQLSRVRSMYGIEPDVLRDWRTRVDRRTAMLEVELTNLLSPSQLDRWPVVQRTMRRWRTMLWGRLHGESVDLIELVEHLELDAPMRERIAPLMHEYEMALDVALQSRNRALWRLEFELNPRREVQPIERPQERYRSILLARRAVRDVNVAYVRQLTELLAPDDVSNLHRAWRRAAFGRLTEEPSSAALIIRAMELDDVNPDQIESLFAVHSSLLTQWDELSNRLYDSILTQDCTVLLDRDTVDHYRELEERVWQMPDFRSRTHMVQDRRDHYEEDLVRLTVELDGSIARLRQMRQMLSNPANETQRERLTNAVETHEERTEELREDLSRTRWRMQRLEDYPEEPPSNALERLLLNRARLDERTAETVRSMLTPQQRALLDQP